MWRCNFLAVLFHGMGTFNMAHSNRHRLPKATGCTQASTSNSATDARRVVPLPVLLLLPMVQPMLLLLLLLLLFLLLHMLLIRPHYIGRGHAIEAWQQRHAVMLACSDSLRLRGSNRLSNRPKGVLVGMRGRWTRWIRVLGWFSRMGMGLHPTPPPTLTPLNPPSTQPIPHLLPLISIA